MKTILDQNKINRAIDDLVDSICKDNQTGEIAIIGVRSRGEIIAQRLSERLRKKLSADIPTGVLDITLYRDDLNSPQSDHQPQVRTTEIHFDIAGKVLILVDDVLHTGRSIRAAMDALIDLGRPKAIRLAVLVERAGREFPIQADYIGHSVDIEKNKSVNVKVTEVDGEDSVQVE